MKIVKTDSLVSKLITESFKARLKEIIQQLINVHALDSILSEFSEDDLVNSVNAIYSNGNYIMLNIHCDGGYILKLLQFGGPKLPAMNVLTKCSIGMEGI